MQMPQSTKIGRVTEFFVQRKARSLGLGRVALMAGNWDDDPHGLLYLFPRAFPLILVLRTSSCCFIIDDCGDERAFLRAVCPISRVQ